MSDLYTELASNIFEVDEAEVTPDQREKAKKIFYAAAYETPAYLIEHFTLSGDKQ